MCLQLVPIISIIIIFTEPLPPLKIKKYHCYFWGVNQAVLCRKYGLATPGTRRWVICKNKKG